MGHRGTGSLADGFSKIQSIPQIEYDRLNRVTRVAYDQGGGTTKYETFIYDQLGNRITSYDDRTGVTKAYANNSVNAYSTITDGIPGSPSTHTIIYDAAGNLSKDEYNYQYGYDEENRLTRVAYDGGGGPTQLAAYEYDAMGRMISAQLRFDADVDGATQTTKYYYDGAKVIAEYWPYDDSLLRRYIDGTQHVDEHAVLLESYYDTFPYYYILQELDTVAGLMAKNGVLAEAYTYDTYGKVSLWGYPRLDFNRDGACDPSERTISNSYNATTPPSLPMADWDCDGVGTQISFLTFFNYFHVWGPAAPLKVSGFGKSMSHS